MFFGDLNRLVSRNVTVNLLGIGPMDYRNNHPSSFLAFLLFCTAKLRHSKPAEDLTISPIVLGTIDWAYRPQRNSELAMLPLWQTGFSG